MTNCRSGNRIWACYQPQHNGEQVIATLISLRQAAARLGRTSAYLKGVCEGLGINLMVAAQALVMTQKDFDRLKRHVESHGLHRQRRKAENPVAAN